MSKAIENAVRQATEETVVSMGYELADVAFAWEKEVEGHVLTLFIYRPEGVSLDDCEAVSRAVDPIIDSIDPTEEPYFLSVSSLGLDRPFHITRDYERYMNKTVDIKLYAPIEPPAADEAPASAPPKAKLKKQKTKQKEFTGILRAVDDETLTLEVEGRPLLFSRAQIAKACPGISW